MPSANHKLYSFFSDNKFSGSFEQIEKIPASNLPEFCFIGRSNVGKSSMINALTKTKNIARTSKIPGRTQTINFFEVSKCLNIVDLPGYGYAKVSKKNREYLNYLIESYISSRENINMVYVLVDCKIGIKNSDIDIFDLISFQDKNFTVIVTKIDKYSRILSEKQINSITSLLKNYKNFKQIFLSSSKKNNGIIDIQKNIFSLTKKNEI